MKRIEQLNSTRNNVTNAEGQESARLEWCSAYKYLKNYLRWEEMLVEMGFCRLPHNEVKRKQEGYVVWKKEPVDQKDRFLNCNELCLYLDGTMEKMAGCPPLFWSALNVAEVGESKFKSSKKATITFGIAGKTPLLPHIILSSSASKGRARLDSRMFPSMKEIVGKFGYTKEYLWQALFSVNESG